MTRACCSPSRPAPPVITATRPVISNNAPLVMRWILTTVRDAMDAFTASAILRLSVPSSRSTIGCVRAATQSRK